MVKNPPSSAGKVGSGPGQGTKSPHATKKQSPRTTTAALTLRSSHKGCKIPPEAAESPQAATEPEAAKLIN